MNEAPSAVFYDLTTNRKLAPVVREVVDGPGRRLRPWAEGPYCSATYASILATCGPCAFKGNGCFVQEGFTKRIMSVLDENAEVRSPDGVVHEEARAIDTSFRGGPVPQDGARGGRDLRLHIGGDAASESGAAALAGAAERWEERGGGKVWTYTHLWREIPRASWGAISVLASCETLAEVQEARELGYVAAIVVNEFPSDTAFRHGDEEQERLLPCPAETRGTTCIECRLCLDDARLRRLGLTIAFALHGAGKKRAEKHALRVI